MEEIKKLLHDSGLASLRDAGITIVSIFGNSGFRSLSAYASGELTNIATTLANRIVGSSVFVSPNEPRKSSKSLEITEGLQLYVHQKSKTAYLFFDAAVNTSYLADACRRQTFDSSSDSECNKSYISSFLLDRQSIAMRNLLLMFLVSHLVIPILPPRILPSEFLSTLVTLSQVKHGIYTHLAQLQLACWKCWDISVPSALFERKEIESRRDRDRMHANLMGWWGPAKGVPLMVFVAADVCIPNLEGLTRSSLPIVMKRCQESIQGKIKHILRASHLVPLVDDNIHHEPIEVRSLFTLPTTTQPFVHVIPATPFATTVSYADQIVCPQTFTFDDPPSLSSWLRNHGEQNSTRQDFKRKETFAQPMESLIDDCGDKLLRNFVAHWIRAATTRHPLHVQMLALSGRKASDSKPVNVPLPTGIQFASSLIPLKDLIIGMRKEDDDDDAIQGFRKDVIAQSPGAKGMIQQIQVILRKKIRDTLDIERVFSRSHSIEIMRKCLEAYIHEAPPCYTRQYHLWKRENALRLYNSLARGPCAAEFAACLERECDLIWKQGRQSCEQISLTGKVCRLKAGHEIVEEVSSKHARDIDGTKHSSGCSFFHACTCGKTQKLREDPFTLKDANVTFYERFSCCLGNGRLAIDLESSDFGEKQNLQYIEDHLPETDSVLLYLGPASLYRNSIGLDKYEGFTNNTNYMLPWSLNAACKALKNNKPAATQEDNVSSKSEREMEDAEKENSLDKTMDANEWPVLGTEPPSRKVTNSENVVKPAIPSVVNMDAFPTLGEARAQTDVSSPATVKAIEEPTSPKKEKRRRDGKRKEREHRLEGYVRGYVGFEYECPLGHRFLSCGGGRVCKLGHKGHPKEHANYVIHQDLPLYVLCPCNAANSKSGPPEVTAQLQRCYVVTPDAPIPILLDPRIQFNLPGSKEPLQVDLGFKGPVVLPRNGFYVLRLPYIYKDANSDPIPMEANVERRLSSAVLLKDCFRTLSAIDARAHQNR